ncbi:unnamed protein product [Symbiodinium sp. CCMP2592]|nr:unnamed protein product [Symbiodinium sp. CCMP2592]
MPWLAETSSTQPWGLMCIVCNRAASSCKFGDRLQLEDLRRHAQSDLHRQSLESLCASLPTDPVQQKMDNAVPTPAQVRLGVEVVLSPAAGQIGTYASKCELAGRGDPLNYPLARSGASEHPRIVEAVAQTLLDMDRELIKGCVAVVFSQDNSGDYASMRVKLVDKSFNVHCRHLQISCVHGKKDALLRVLPDEGVFTTDGESAETLAGRMVKGVFPNLLCTHRCLMHSAQRGLEAAVKSDTALSKLLDQLVFRYSAVNNVKDPGSLTRALHNCCRLKAKFDEKARASLHAVDELVGKASSASWAPQRFDSILSAVKKIVMNLDSILELLVETASFQNCQQEWARKLLAVFTAPNIRALALLTEWLSICSRYVHMYDKDPVKASSPTTCIANIARTSSLADLLKKDAWTFFLRKSWLQVPHVLNPKYTAGYVSVAERAMRFSFQPAWFFIGTFNTEHKHGHSDSNFEQSLCKELGSIRNISKIFLESITCWHTTGVAGSLCPFDVLQWHKKRKDDCLKHCFDPLAAMLQVDGGQLEAEFLLARPTALHLARAGHLDYWPQTMNHWGSRLPVLCKVRCLLCIFDSTSAIESSFSTYRLFTKGAKASITETHRNLYMKVFCDAPPPDMSFICESAVWIARPTTAGRCYEATPFCNRVLQTYRVLNGGQGKNTKSTNLPRRLMKSRLRAKGLQAFDRRKTGEVVALTEEQSKALDPSVVEKIVGLDDVVQKAAKDRTSQKQIDLLLCLKKKARERQEAFIHGPRHEGAAKLKELERDVLKNAEQLCKVEQRQMAKDTRTLAPVPTWVVIVGEATEDKHAIKRRVLEVCKPEQQVVIHGVTSFLTQLHKASFYETLPGQIVYLCSNYETLLWLTDPTLDIEDESDKQKKRSHLVLATRLLGGYVCGPSWLERLANSPAQALPAPILQLRSAMLTPHQVYLGKQLPGHASDFWWQLHKGLLNSRLGDSVSMVLRDKKKHKKKRTLIVVPQALSGIKRNLEKHKIPGKLISVQDCGSDLFSCRDLSPFLYSCNRSLFHFLCSGVNFWGLGVLEAFNRLIVGRLLCESAMGKPGRKSKAKAKANPETEAAVPGSIPASTEEYAKAWDLVQEAILTLRAAGTWVEHKTEPNPLAGLCSLPNDFKGCLRCNLVLGDLDFVNPNFSTMSLSRTDVASARAYWYNPAAPVAELPTVTALCSDDSQLFRRCFFVGPQIRPTVSGIFTHMAKIWKKSPKRLQLLLKSMGKRSTAEDIFQEFQAKVADGKLKFASEESKVRSSDMVSKLLRLRERATEASTWELLREMQRGPSGVTWAGRWSSAVRLLGPSRDKVDFEWLIKQLARAFGNEFFDKKFDRSVAEMTKESVETTCKALLATRRLMARLVKECSAPGQSRKWLDSLAGMLSPERIHVSTATDISDDFLATAMLGATDSEAGVLTLLNDLANLKYLKAIGAVAAYVNTSSSQWSDHRIQSIVSETVQAYGKEHLRPIVPPAVTEPPPAPAEEPETAAWNDADVAAAGPGSSTSAPATAVLRDQRLREAATHEMQRYSKMLVVSDLVDANGVQSVLSPMLKMLQPRMASEQEHRVWVFDSAMLMEQTALKLFGQTATDARDVFLAFDSGSAKGGSEIRRSFAKMQKQHDTWTQTAWTLLPASQRDLEARASFRETEPSTGQSGKRRKKAASLSALGGSEGAHVMAAGFTLQARDLRFLSAIGIDSSYPFLHVPLLAPCDVEPLVTREDKEKELVPLHYWSKHPSCYKELLHLLQASCLVAFSPDPTLLLAALEMRVSCIVLCRSTAHMKELQDYLFSALRHKMLDASCTRFYQNLDTGDGMDHAAALRQQVEEGQGGDNCTQTPPETLAIQPADTDTQMQGEEEDQCEEEELEELEGEGGNVEDLLKEIDSPV